MNLLLRSMIVRQSPLVLCRRHLASEKSRRALRSFLQPEKRSSPIPSPSSRNSSRSPFGFINEKNVIYGIILANGIVFAVWQFSYANLRSNLDERLLWFMTKHFSMFVWKGQKNIQCISSGLLGRSGRTQSCLDSSHLGIQSFWLHSFFDQ